MTLKEFKNLKPGILLRFKEEHQQKDVKKFYRWMLGFGQFNAIPSRHGVMLVTECIAKQRPPSNMLPDFNGTVKLHFVNADGKTGYGFIYLANKEMIDALEIVQ